MGPQFASSTWFVKDSQNMSARGVLRRSFILVAESCVVLNHEPDGATCVASAKALMALNCPVQ